MILKPRPLRERLVAPRRRQGGFVINPYSMGNDPYWSNVIFLLQRDEADGSTTFTDSSNAGTAITAFGDVQHDTSVTPPYGSSSILFDGSGDYLRLPDSAAWAFGSSSWTMQMWIRFSSVAATQQIIGKRLGSNYGPFSIIFNAGIGRIEAFFDSNVADFTWLVSLGNAPITVNTWHFYEVFRDGTTFGQFLDGVYVAQFTGVSDSLAPNTEPIYIGARSDGSLPASCRIKGLRVTAGVARNTTGYTVPNGPWPES